MHHYNIDNVDFTISGRDHFGVLSTVSEPFLLILKRFEKTYCVFGTIDPPNLDHCRFEATIEIKIFCASAFYFLKIFFEKWNIFFEGALGWFGRICPVSSGSIFLECRHRRARAGFGPKSLEMQSKRFEIDRIGLKSNRNTFVAINIRFQSEFHPESTRIPSLLKDPPHSEISVRNVLPLVFSSEWNSCL